jgi:hypothetical protein
MSEYEQAKWFWKSCQKDLHDAIKNGELPSRLKFWEDRCVEAYEIMKRLEDESI